MSDTDPNQPGYSTPPPPAPAATPPPAAGYPAPTGPGGTAPKSKMTAGLLGIFLGGFGVHNFYLGFTNKAILQIVVTVVTCGLGSIWGLIEGILILTGNENFQVDANGVPLVD